MKVKAFRIEDSGFSDLDSGMVTWEDGTEEFYVDVRKLVDDDTPLSEFQLKWLHRELCQHMIGLETGEQIMYLTLGVTHFVLTTDDEWLKENFEEES